MYKDKTAVITGGVSGIGKEISVQFAAAGANIAIVSIVPAPEGLISELEGYGVKAKVYLGDVSSYDDTAAIIKEIQKDFGTIDYLINNAGITKDGLIMRMSEENFDDVIHVNLKGTFNMTKHISAIMLRQKSGRIVSIASVVGIFGNAGQANYAASKAGIIGLTKSVSKELGSRGITVNAIAPGFIATAMTDVLDDAVKEKMVERLSIKRLGSPADIAATALFLCSDGAGYITGQVIGVDGGLSL
ncbi:MAG: 3-oxoacyl-[acyl-carrier-protein] reductase [Clostridiales bacterium 43-6]|nr:MAG: 3-oxoacyl-[acyl-carrier-protein] reductase [Clostridiales bacterium 43-6]